MKPELPKSIFVFKALSLIKTVSIVFLGRSCKQDLVRWWCRQPARFIRGWSLPTCTVGTFLIYAEMQAGVMAAIAAISAGHVTGDGECRAVRRAIMAMPRLSL